MTTELVVLAILVVAVCIVVPMMFRSPPWAFPAIVWRLYPVNGAVSFERTNEVTLSPRQIEFGRLTYRSLVSLFTAEGYRVTVSNSALWDQPIDAMGVSIKSSETTQPVICFYLPASYSGYVEGKDITIR